MKLELGLDLKQPDQRVCGQLELRRCQELDRLGIHGIGQVDQAAVDEGVQIDRQSTSARLKGKGTRHRLVDVQGEARVSKRGIGKLASGSGSAVLKAT